MHRLLVPLALGAALLSGPPLARAQSGTTPLEPPDGNVFVFKFQGTGSQVWVCRAIPSEPNNYAWDWQGPDVTLQNDLNQTVGRYTAGYTYTANDGSSFTGSVTQTQQSPRPGAPPWTLQQATPAATPGIFSSITYVQEAETNGGMEPTAACGPAQAGQVQNVSYSAEFNFFITTAPR